MEKLKLVTYIFTFGSGQMNQGCRVEIKAKDWRTARDRMFELYNDKWCFQYNEKEWADTLELLKKYGCKPEKLISTYIVEEEGYE